MRIGFVVRLSPLLAASSCGTVAFAQQEGSMSGPLQTLQADIVGGVHARPSVRNLSSVEDPRLYNAGAFAAPCGLTNSDVARNLLRKLARIHYDVGLSSGSVRMMHVHSGKA